MYVAASLNAQLEKEVNCEIDFYYQTCIKISARSLLLLFQKSQSGKKKSVLFLTDEKYLT